jgi:rare lipoprotein A
MRQFLIIAAYLLSFALQAQVQEGIASYYSDKFEGRKTASGEKYRGSEMTAAHRFLPFGTIVKVTNLENGNSVELKINDRGPFVEGRIIDVSWAAAEKLNFITQGLVKVKVEVVDAGSGIPSKNKSGTNVDSAAPRESDFYLLRSEYVYPQGFGVQLASFSEPANLVGMTASLRNAYHKQVHVQVKRINNRQVYAVILGDFKTRAKAEKLLQKAKKQFPDAFIVTYANLK